MDKLKRYIINVLIAIDQLFATVFLFQDPDETISSFLGKHRANSKVVNFFARTVDFLFFWERNHTIKSVEWDEGKDDVFR